MIKIGITGQNGFIGEHLFNTLKQKPNEYKLIIFNKTYFKSAKNLEKFVSQCDVIVHLAAMNRHPDPEVIYKTNTKLVEKLV